MSKKLALVLALATTLLPLAANALGLGEIKLNSALNQPLSADIAIVGATPSELDSLKVVVASQQQFQQAGLDRADVLNQLQFQVVKHPDGSATLHVSSTQLVREPFLDFLIDATWDNGELLREYTVFLNPPNFETPAPAAAAPAQVQSAPGTAPVAAPTAPATQPAAATPVPAAAPTPAPSITAPPATTTTEMPAPTALGGNYGPIHRGETLSEIALRMRPKGVTLNQMMIAIYRANPEVFMHNINRMKAGYVMRLPSMADIQAVNVGDANSEVRTQIEEWRASRGQGTGKPSAATPPSLQLVAPTSAAETAENQIPGAGKGGTGNASEAKSTTKIGEGAVPAATTANGQAPIAVPNSGLAAVQNQASNANKPAVKSPVNHPARAPAPETSTSGGLLDTLMNPYVIVSVIIVIILVVIGVFIKKRSGAASMPTPKRIKIKTADEDWQDQEKAGLKDVTATGMGKAAAETLTDDEMSRSTVTMKGPITPMAAAAKSGATAKLDESDPMAEADFHMAYGLYDQAADVLKKALQQDPGRRDLKMKLLEVFFTAGNRASFVDTARSLRQEMGASPDRDWENVAIMGRQVAPDESLFSATGVASATSDSVDIALDSGGTSTVVGDPLAGAFAGISAPGAGKIAPAVASDSPLDLSLPGAATADAKITEESKTAKGGMDFDLSGLDIEPAGAAKKTTKAEEPTVTTDFGTDSQVEFDKALKELADFVNTNVPPQEDAPKTAVSPGLSLAAEPPGVATGIGQDTTGGLNEIGTKLDLARAYIDMGDADGARNILDEVMAEGDAQQKKQAQELMKHLA